MSDHTPRTAPALLDTARVSVVIPAYKSADVLPEAIESVIAQTRPADEIIVVDDGSADPTPAVCKRYGNRVRCLVRKNGRASAARNTGIAAATGDWLAFLDADDAWDPHKLELQLTALDQQPDADFCITASLVWSPDENSYILHGYAGPLDPQHMRAELLVRNIFTGLCSSMLIRRTALDAVGRFPAGKGSEDRRIAIELLARHRALILPHALIRQQPGPAHWTDPERQRVEMLRLIADYHDLYAVLDPTGRLLRRARARMYERSGMHHLANGDLQTAARDLKRAARLWPWMPNPWRVLINACLGRLRIPATA